MTSSNVSLKDKLSIRHHVYGVIFLNISFPFPDQLQDSSCIVPWRKKFVPSAGFASGAETIFGFTDGDVIESEAEIGRADPGW